MDSDSDYDRRGSRHVKKRIVTDAANSTNDRYEQPRSSSSKRKERTEKIPYFIDAARESDRLRSQRRRDIETRKYKQGRQNSREVIEGFEGEERHKPRPRYDQQHRNKISRSRSRNHSHNQHQTLRRSRSHEISPVPERIPMYIPIPVPTAVYPFGYSWPTLSRHRLQPQHLLPVYSPLAQCAMHLRPQPPHISYYGQRPSFRYNTRFQYHNRPSQLQQRK